MMYECESPRGLLGRIKRIAAAVVLIIRALAFPAEVILHREFGPRYIGAQGAMVPVLLISYALAWPPFLAVPILVFAAIHGLLHAAAIAEAATIQRERDQLPDYYSGYPRYLWLFGFLSERTAKRFVEPLIVALIAWLIRIHHEPFGHLLFAMAAALFVSVNLKWGFSRMSVLDGKIDPNKPIQVQVRRVTRDSAPWAHAASRPFSASGGNA